ncbi:hypothetical protein EZV62_018423 [Acer yangbiense]|uniref:CCHC-type domain-containing protein n=1 Tax=Acer yangbiense TaxID=1000413 RepID=A0A5C7HJC2_9ROSI|nr:hypothetical protein EZV62_018423 [Acer yangbiense]
MRVKIRIDITKPLKWWLRLKLAKIEEVTMVGLKYERLPEFCYACGKTGHGMKECLDEEARKVVSESFPLKLRSWLKATISEKSKTRFKSSGNESSSDRARSSGTSHETEGDGSISRVSSPLHKLLEISKAITRSLKRMVSSPTPTKNKPVSKKGKSPMKVKKSPQCSPSNQCDEVANFSKVADKVCKRKVVFNFSDEENRELKKGKVSIPKS